MRYFFHLRRGPEVLRDETGVELDSPAAIENAVREACQEFASDVPGEALWREWTLQVEDQLGATIVEYPLFSLG